MKSIRFGNYDSFLNLDLILTNSIIETPKPKTSLVEIDGADGSVDYTEAFGDVFYGTRQLSFDFTYHGNESTFAEKFSSLQNLLHGQKMNIVISDDPDFYYIGRIELDQWKSSKAIRKINIECVCEPYKYQTVKRIFSITSNPQTIKFENLRMKTKPTLLCSQNVSVVCNGKTVSLTAGTTNTGTIIFNKNINSLVVSGTNNATLTITCIRGSL